MTDVTKQWHDEMEAFDVLRDAQALISGSRYQVTLTARRDGLHFLQRTRKGFTELDVMPWSDVAKVELFERRTQKGRKHSMIGLGLVGVAAVGAMAVHNHRVGQIVVSYVVRITATSGASTDFTPDPNQFISNSRKLAGVVKLIQQMPNPA